MINFRYYSLSQVQEAKGVAVVIDVLRAFTTAAFAFDVGVNKIFPVAGVEEALQLRNLIPGSLIMGEIDGIKPEGFDLGNSPADISCLDLSNKILIQRTTAGTQGVVRVVEADKIFAASFVIAKVTANFIRKLHPSLVSFVITGASQGRDGDEDLACAEYIEALVKNSKPDPWEYINRVKSSIVGQLFLEGNNSNFQLQDLIMSLHIDRFPYLIQVKRENKRLVMEKHVPG